jgi:hypothetical protein
MVKLFLIPSCLSLALGALLGYHLQKLESAPITKQDTGEAIAATGKAKQVLILPDGNSRATLETKYFLCTATPPNPRTLARFDDKALNDLVYSVCTENS